MVVGVSRRRIVNDGIKTVNDKMNNINDKKTYKKTKLYFPPNFLLLFVDQTTTRLVYRKQPVVQF